MNIKTFADAVGMDYERVIEDFCGDTAALGAMIAAYPEKAGYDDLRKALESGGAEAARKSAHRLRKESERIGLDEIAELAQKIEKAGDDRLKSFAEPLDKAWKTITDALSE